MMFSLIINFIFVSPTTNACGMFRSQNVKHSAALRGYASCRHAFHVQFLDITSYLNVVCMRSTADDIYLTASACRFDQPTCYWRICIDAEAAALMTQYTMPYLQRHRTIQLVKLRGSAGSASQKSRRDRMNASTSYSCDVTTHWTTLQAYLLSTYLRFSVKTAITLSVVTSLI